MDGSFSDGLQGTVPLPSRMGTKNMEKKHTISLGGGFTQIFFKIFTPKLGEDGPNLTVAYFSDGWEKTTN